MQTMTLTEARLDEAGAEAISAQKQEPTWFLDLRRRAWRFYEELPWPTGNEEEWRRTRLTGLDLADFRLPDLSPVPALAQPADSRASLPSHLRDELGTIELAGALATEDGVVRHHVLSSELAAKGVIFTSLDTAIRQHPELIQRYFMTDNVAVEANKFTALHAASSPGALCSMCRATCRSSCHCMA